MSILVADCPRCGASSMTFDVGQQVFYSIKYQWQRWYEVFSVCRNCHRSTTFIVSQLDPSSESAIGHEDALVNCGGSINDYVKVERYVSLRDESPQAPPDYVPGDVKAAFEEAATCLSVECWNAAGAMFRMCIDLATRPLLPEEDVTGLTHRVRRDLGLRLPWLFDNGRLPPDIRDLSTAVREDGNDGAHAGTLKREDALDLFDFTWELLERLFTKSEQLKLAEARRQARRSPKG